MGTCTSARKVDQERIVFRGTHKEKHGDGKPEGHARGEKAPTAEAVGFGWHGSALVKAGAGPFDKAFLHAPDHAPGVHQHKKTQPAADADAEVRVGNYRAGGKDEAEVGPGDDYDCDGNDANKWIVQQAFTGKLQRVDQGVGDKPE